jgi:hypothetical protein
MARRSCDGVQGTRLCSTLRVPEPPYSGIRSIRCNAGTPGAQTLRDVRVQAQRPPRSQTWHRKPMSRARTRGARGRERVQQRLDQCNCGWCSSPREVVTTYTAINTAAPRTHRARRWEPSSDRGRSPPSSIASVDPPDRGSRSRDRRELTGRFANARGRCGDHLGLPPPMT